MLTIRFTYFGLKCMNLSKLLYNPWSTFFVLIYFIGGFSKIATWMMPKRDIARNY